MAEKESNPPDATLIAGLVCVLIGIGIVFLFSQMAELSCVRPEPSALLCKRTTKLFGLIPLREEPLMAVRRAQLAEICDYETDECSYRVELQTAEGVVPLDSAFTGGVGARRRQAQRVEKINIFLSDSSASELTAGVTFFAILMSFLPLLIIGFGGFLLFAGLRPFLAKLNQGE